MDSLLNDITSAEFLNPIWLSLKVTLAAGVTVILLGTVMARILARKQFKGKIMLETVLMLPLVLPPTVAGFLLVVTFGKEGPLGRLIELVFQQQVIFTWIAAVIASVVVAFPLMYQSAKSGFQAVDADIENAAKVDGARRWQVFVWITIPLASRSLISGSILSVARALGEFGATLMVAGNIPGKTQTVPTAIYIALNMGDKQLVWMWVLVIIVISFLLLLTVQRK